MSPEATIRLAALLILGLSAWQANRAVCRGCTSADVDLRLTDGTPIRARLYLPDGRADLPAVVVCHGYLANLAFLEIPWAADLARLGVAALFLDRRGHGYSGGRLWSDGRGATSLDDLEPDVAAAIAYVRSRAPLVDPDRVAVLGHSDGASAALTAASADWDVRATVAMSASLAPWQYVSHAAPRNLLLVYGAGDHFVLNETDRLLIGQATRGYLVGPGRYGSFAQHGARQLLSVPGRGHVDIIYSKPARREALHWLQQSLGADGEVRLVSPRLLWVGSGLAALVVLLAVPFRRASRERGSVVPEPSQPRHHGGRLATLSVVWVAGLCLAPLIADLMQDIPPTQEGRVFAGLLVGPALPLVAFGSCVPSWRRSRSPALPAGRRRRLAGGTEAILSAVMVVSGLQVLLLHHYEVSSAPLRLGLLVFYAGLALPPFVLLEWWLLWADSAAAHRVACRLVLAAATAVAAGSLFERMSMVPGFLLAAVLVLSAARDAGCPLRNASAGALFAALVFGRIASAVCVLY